MDRAYSGMGGAWTPDKFDTLPDQFPEGQICIEDNDRTDEIRTAFVGMAISYNINIVTAA